MKNIVAGTAFVLSSLFAHAQDNPKDWRYVNSEGIVNKEVITRKSATLVFINKAESFDATTGKRLIETFFTVYPKEVKTYNPKAPDTVTVVIDPTYTGVAAAASSLIRINPEWLRKNPEDIDVITHEAMHLVQSYPHRAGPGWITEGIADYVRHKMGVNNEKSGWKLTPFQSSHHYTNAYRITARFFCWVEQQYDKKLVKQLDHAMRTKTYSPEFWVKHTGLPVDTLWTKYSADPSIKGIAETKAPIAYVNPMIGTQRMGHVFPGATVPFGMVQLSPDTDTIPYAVNGKYNPDVYKYCAGYQYDDKTIVGFSHTHFSGTGHSDLGDFLLMPTTGELKLNPGTALDPSAGYRSRFSHQNEKAEANYYSVLLDDYKIKAELTATERVGMHRYSFPKNKDAHIIFDLMSGIYNYNEKNVWTFVRVENDTLVTGYRQTHGWGRTRVLYFAMSFSRPIKNYGSRSYEPETYKGFWRKFDQTDNFPELAGKKLRMFFDFDTQTDTTVQVKMALSAVSRDGALLNLATEAPGWNFDAIKNRGQALWSRELNKLTIQASEEDKVNFYTAAYHAYINPTIYMDVDGKYRGLDQSIHQADGFVNYTTFSLWDTYRALHPLYNLIQPKRNSDAVQSMLAHYDQSTLHMLPIWSNSANENWCMTGYHSVSVLADAVVKKVPGFNAERALEAAVTTARNRRYDGLNWYLDKGYIPVDKNATGVSTTLEYAYDDWAIAQMARHLGKTDIANEFAKRAENFRNVFDSSTGFMRARLNDGSFRKPFDPLNTHGEGFIEGNAWNFSLFVPQDPTALGNLLGGRKKMEQYLDTLFAMHLPDSYFANTEDITRDGIIGGYVHGNEPAHHVAYLYNWTNQPWKTQQRVRMILKNQYHNGPDGLGGNDDTGQMSAWYIFSSLGFYPVAPGSPVYQIGSPEIEGATLQLENGNKFAIEVKNQSAANVYIQKIELNGRALDRLYLQHDEIVKGGKLVYYMSSKPNKAWKTQ